MKKLLSVLMALVMCFGVFSGALAEIVVVPASGRLDENTEYEMIETDLPSGVYDDGRTLIIHPDDGNMLFDYDPEAASSGGTVNTADASELDAVLNVANGMLTFDNTVSDYPWEVVNEGGRSYARSTNQGINNSKSSFKLTAACIDGQVLSFDYLSMGCSNGWYNNVFEASSIKEAGYEPSWNSFSCEITSTGVHSFSFTFSMGNSNSGYGDYACVDNISISTPMTEPMILPSDFDDITIEDGFLAEIEPPVEGAIPVYNAKQLYDIRNNPNGNYYLTSDISISDLETYGLTWTSIPDYNGIFDGQGHSIGVLPDSLFQKAQGTIKNLAVNVDICKSSYAGAVVIQANGAISFNNCIVNGNIDGGYYSGGLVGYTDAGSYSYYSLNCENCINRAAVSGTANAGGIIGYARNRSAATLTNCINTAPITSNRTGGDNCYAGGIIGYVYGSTATLTNCINTAPVTANNTGNYSSYGANSGGMIGGGSDNYLTNCRNNGEVMANSVAHAYAGGMTGWSSYANVQECINTATVTACSGANGIAYAGGISGEIYNPGTVSDCVNTADVSSSADGSYASYSGGLVGYWSYRSVFRNCFVDCGVSSYSKGANSYSGGAAGYSSSNVEAYKLRVINEDIYAETEAENSYAYIGGIVGYANSDAFIGYCLTNVVDGSAYDSWHVYKGSITGYVVNTLGFADICSYNSLNNYSGYFGTVMGRDNAIPYSGQLINRNANYTIRVVDAQTGAPLSNATVRCDGYRMTTDAFGMVRMTLPVDVMIRITAARELYETFSTYTTKLNSNGINTINLRYVGVLPSDIGSGSGSGSTGGGVPSINSGGFSFSAPSVSGPTSTATGPNISLLGKTSPAFKVDLGVDLPYSKLSVSVDYEKQTIRLLLNADIKASYSEDDQGNEQYKAEFENKWKKISDNLQKMNRGENVANWQKDLVKSSGKIGLQGDVYFGGAIMLSFANGDLRLISGSGVMGLKASVKLPKHPFLVVCYFQIKLSGKLEFCPTLEIDENSVITYKGTAKVSAKLTGALGVRDLIGLAHAEGGVECTATTEVTFPWKSAAESLKAKGKVEAYVELQAIYREIKKSWTWAEFQLWPKNKDTVNIDMTPYLNNDAAVPMSRDYLKNTGLTRAVGDESLVMNSVFPYGEPQICQLDDGRIVLVWVHDDGSRTDDNRTALYYSVYDNGTWSEPAMVWDDGTGDFYPVIAADGNNVHIVWQNLSEVLPDGTELDTSLTKTQICYTKLKWDGTIETPYVVDAAGYYQSDICMAAENGNVVVAWTENSSNNIWNETGTYNVYRRYMTSGSWYSTNTVISGAALITEVACGYIDGTPNVAYIQDVDGNAASVTDLEVYKYVGSSRTRITNNSVIDCNIQYVNNDLYWRQDGELRNAGGLLGLVTEDDVTLAKAPDGSLVAIIKSVVDGFNTELYGSFMNSDGAWSVPAPITNYYGAIRSFCPIVCENGSIAIALDNAELQQIEQNDDEAYGTTSMYVIIGSSLTDLIVTEDMAYDADEVVPGEDLPLTVTVYNNSINAVNGVKAEFYDENEQLVYTATVDDNIECGEEKEITFSFSVPEELTLTEYTVKVLPASVEDDIPDNNETSVTIGYADIAVENGRFTRTETAAIVEADIVNNGFTAAENVVASLRYQGVDGDFLGSIDLGNMAAGATEHVSFDIPTTYLENDSELDLNTFYLYIETDTAESHAYNNSDAIVDEPIRVTSISLDITQRDMLVHDTMQLNATLQPADAANQLIRWASTNVDVATVDDNGLVTCVGEGSAIIYAISADGVYSEGCMINTQYPYYTVTFLDDDGTVLKTEQVKETSDATPPEVEAREGYTFVGWDGDYTHISGDITLIAQYEINTYHVIYYINGEVYHTDEFEFGSEIVPLDEPELEGYTFMGWDDIPEIMPAEDVIVTGEVEINSYKLNYYVDGQFYHRDTYDYGTYITPIEEPTREDCVFSGWSDIPATMPAHNINIYGTFSKITYTVTFLDWDGRVIESQQVEIHSDAVPPADPMRIGYTFTGWDGDYTGVEADATVTATYTINSYTVIFKDWDGMVLDMQTVEYGSSAIAPQVPEREGYTFIGWDKEFDFVEENMTVTAQYINNTDIVTFEKYNSFELKSGYYVIYGVNGNYHGAMNNVMTSKRMGVTDVEIVDDVIKNPEEAIIWKIDVNSEGVLTIFNEAEGKYLEITINNASGFTYADEPTCGYTYEYDEVTETYLITTTCEDASDRCISIYQTDFRCLNSGGAKELYLYRMANNHTVTFVDWNGAVLSVQRVNDGEAAYAPTDPEREGYTFIGWDAEFTNVTEDIVITAQYTINNYTLTILYKYADGTPAAETYSEAYDYGAAYSITSPEIEGWTADIVVVEGTMSAQDMTVIVTYSPILPPFIPGDVNSDGIIDSLDVLLIMRFTLGIVEFTDMQMIIGDVNGDGVVNGSDAIIVMRQAIGII